MPVIVSLPPFVVDLNAFIARGVVKTDVPNLSQFQVSNGIFNDLITFVQNDVVLLQAQTIASQRGPWVVGPVVAGLAQLSRPSWWASGAIIPSGQSINVGGEGSVFANTVWQSMPLTGMSTTVDAADPELFPRRMAGSLPLTNGQVTLTQMPIRSQFTAFTVSRKLVNTVANTVMYAPTNNGGSGVIVGAIPTGQVTFEACLAAGTTNVADQSQIFWTMNNQDR